MREMNFFNPYLDKKQQGLRGHRLYIVIGITAFTLAVAYYAVSWYFIYAIRQDISEMNEYMHNPANSAKVQKYLNTEIKLDALKQYDVAITTVNAYAETQGQISSAYLEELDSALPQTVFLQSANFQKDGVEIQGIGSSRTAIAEYQHNLKNLGIFEKVFVGNITADQAGTNLIFSIECSNQRGDAQ